MQQEHVVQKVLAYIVREANGKLQLLVNTHKDYPEAGVQVPSGTWEQGETAEQALLREIHEETGLARISILGKVAEYTYFHAPRGEYHQRHIFLAKVMGPTPDSWEHVDRSVTGGGSVVLNHFWTDLSPDLTLAVGHGDYLHTIEQFLQARNEQV